MSELDRLYDISRTQDTLESYETDEIGEDITEIDLATVMYALTMPKQKRHKYYAGRLPLITLAYKTRFLKELEDDKTLRLFWKYMSYAKSTDSSMEIVALRRLLYSIIAQRRTFSTFAEDLADAAVGKVF